MASRISGQPCFLLHITVISIENFYWILYINLLRPAGLDCWYYFPWGTKKNFSRHEFKKLEGKQDYAHVFFHFDQEPLWSDQLGPYDHDPQTWSSKYAKILANSEQSLLKRQICRSRDFLDWYFFYHGFAALDWYQDAKFIEEQHDVIHSFVSLNHASDRRAYRIAMLARLVKKNIAHMGILSFHASFSAVENELCDPNTDLTITSKELIHDVLKDLQHLPYKLDEVPIDGNLSARFGHNEYRLWQKSLWHIVNETVFYESKLHLTEKVFKPIVAQRPFMLLAAPGNLAYLKNYGFKTFDRWIDESYDDIQDPDLRMDAITNEIDKFAGMSIPQLRDIHTQMLPVLDYNKKHFFGQFRKIIVDELVDNFADCIKIWNNGRINGRELSPLADPQFTKKMLLA